ncbi:MAG: hypothetical protein ACLQOZ_03635 [Acidimicrobiales bacterium]
MAQEMRRLVFGDLRGMIDAPLVVLDLSAGYHSPALGVLMARAIAWVQHAVQASDHHRAILVVNEAFAIAFNLGTQGVAAKELPRRRPRALRALARKRSRAPGSRPNSLILETSERH